MGNIKEYEELMILTTKSGDEYPFPISENEKVHKMREEKKFIRFGDVTISCYEIKDIKKKNIDPMNSFILSYDNQTRELLRGELQKRNKSGFTTNGPEHLKQIAEDRGWI